MALGGGEVKRRAVAARGTSGHVSSFARVALIPQGNWEARVLPGAVCRSVWDQRESAEQRPHLTGLRPLEERLRTVPKERVALPEARGS